MMKQVVIDMIDNVLRHRLTKVDQIGNKQGNAVKQVSG